MIAPFQLGQLLLDNSAGSESWDSGGSGSVMVVLFVLLIGCTAAAWFYIKRNGLPARKGTGNLEVVETRPLGGRQFLIVARHGEERFLLGVCPGKIDFLTALKADPEATRASDFAQSMRAAERDAEGRS